VPINPLVGQLIMDQRAPNIIGSYQQGQMHRQTMADLESKRLTEEAERKREQAKYERQNQTRALMGQVMGGKFQQGSLMQQLGIADPEAAIELSKTMNIPLDNSKRFEMMNKNMKYALNLGQQDPDLAYDHMSKYANQLSLQNIQPTQVNEWLEDYTEDPAKAMKTLEYMSGAFDKVYGIDKKTGTSKMQKTASYVVRDKNTGVEAIATGIFDPNTGKIETKLGSLDGYELVSKLGETGKELSEREIEQKRQETALAGQEKRATELIDRGVLAAESTATIRRAIGLLDDVKTGGVNNAIYQAKRIFGVESANEAELSNSLGKAVLSQLRETFGAQFTEQEGKRLERIEASFGKSTEGNKRLLVQVLRIAERTAKRARAAALKRKDMDTVKDIDNMLKYELALVPEGDETKPITATGKDGTKLTLINGEWVKQ